MAAPDYVPVAPGDLPRRGEQLPSDSWRAERPADLTTFQPRGPGFGNPGPDQGFGLKLARRFADRLRLQPGEHADDVVAGALLIGLKRAALFGRAPVSHDFDLAYRLFGCLDDAPAEVAAWRRALFAGAAHDYWAQRRVVDAVPDEVLRMTPDDAATRGRDLLRSA